MNSVNFAERQAVMAKTESEGADAFQHHLPVEPHANHQLEALIVLDARGRIQYSGDGIPSLESGQHASARPINTLIPSLPLREGTPGYNIAYVRCAFAEGVWQKHILSTETQLIPIEIHLRTVPVGGGFCLLGLLRISVQDVQDQKAHSSAHEHPEFRPEWHISGTPDAMLNSSA